MIHLFDRLIWAKENLKPVQSQYAVVFEDDMDEAVAVMAPDPNWMAAALHGNLLPPVEVYSQLEVDDQGRVLNGYILHQETVPAMTEEEAVEYLIQKDIPPHVWQDTTSNRPKFKICKRDQIPEDRTLRNAWSLTA